MIHIATVHFKSGRWIEPQQRFLRKHLRSPFQVYAWLNDIPEWPKDAFHYTCTEPVVSHAVKLNLLADLIQFAAGSDDDILLFIDGDAFPIGNVEKLFQEKLARHKLIAVQRLENQGDCQPHPCFCATTVGFWKSIKGDWKEGFQWTGRTGEKVSDVGGNLLGLMQRHQVDWLPLVRSGGITDHPVLFGFYGGLVYHHGAGFRAPVTRFDEAKPGDLNLLQRVMTLSPARRARVLRRQSAAQNDFASEKIFKNIQEQADYLQNIALLHSQGKSPAPLSA
jgi:hypothetical protein